MNEIIAIDDLVLTKDTIIQKRKNPYLFITLVLAGIAVLVEAYSPSLMDKMNLVTGLWVLGFSLIVVGVVGLAVPRKAFYYKPTGEPLKRKVMYFNAKDKNKIMDALTNGNPELLPAQIECSRTALMVILYCTPQNTCMLAQPMEYVPFQYVAIQPAICREAMPERA